MAYSISKKTCLKYKVFDISSIKGIKNAENYQKNLYKKFNVVEIIPIGIDKVGLCGTRWFSK